MHSLEGRSKTYNLLGETHYDMERYNKSDNDSTMTPLTRKGYMYEMSSGDESDTRDLSFPFLIV